MQYILMLLICLTQFSWARFMTDEEAGIQYECVNYNITINQDFTTHWIIDQQQRLLNESARENMKLVQLYYHDNFESIKLLNAAITNKTTQSVDTQLIEDKTLASQPIGFTDTRQILIPFKNVQVGSQVAIKYARTTKQPLIDNHFSTRLHYGEDGYWKASITKITSKVPLYLYANDPLKVLKIETAEKSGTYYYTIELLRPFTIKTINEPGSSLLSPDLQTWVSISTDNTWADFGKNIAAKYEVIAGKDLPDEFINTVESAKKLKNEAERINHITAFIQDKIRYLGDWKITERGFYPRDITTIVDTEYGDCKDFATLTVAMLRKLGLTAKFALVNRGEIIGEYLNALPGITFNHAMVYVESPNGKIYWIDPTNKISMATGLFPDIANRHALVLDTQQSQYIKIPEIDLAQSITRCQHEYQLKPTAMRKTIDITFENEQAIPYTGLELFAHKGVIEDYIYSHYPEHNIPKNQRIRLVLPVLTSRILKNINFILEYIVEYPYARSNLGNAINLDSYNFDCPDDSVHDIYLGSPQTYIKKYVFDQEIANINALDASISTPWLELTRKGTITSGKTIIVDKYVIKKSYLTQNDRQSKQYNDFKNKINQAFKKALLVIADSKEVS